MWFIVDIMELRGFSRDVGALMVSVAGIGNFVGRISGGLLRLYTR